MSGVHGFEEKSKFHVPGYMDLKKKQNSMYRVHESEKKIFLCVAQAVGEAQHIFFFFLESFFQHVKKLINFWNFVNIKVAKSKSNHLGFYCKLDFFDRTIRKSQKLKLKLRTN